MLASSNRPNVFEHSPGRRDPRFTGDRSAFDVSVRYESPSGQRDFLGIEVKHHETLNDKASEHRSRYDEIADVTAASRPNGGR